MRRCELTFLDLGWPGRLAELVPVLDEAGFDRYWSTEHHGAALRSGAPGVVAAVAGCLTERMRIGTAGILYRYASPHQIAQQAKLLSIFFGGRVDLGLASARSDEERLHTELMDGRSSSSAEPEMLRLRLRQAVDAIRDQSYQDSEDEPPAIWVCGSSLRSAQEAAELGVSYSFQHSLTRETTEERFRLAQRFEGATAFHIAVLVLVGDDDEVARSYLRTTLPEVNHDAYVVGTPTTCARALAEIVARYDGASGLALGMIDELARDDAHYLSLVRELAAELRPLL